jgi:hypothetical protein
VSATTWALPAKKMTMEGWIKLHRKIADSEIYPKGREFTKYEAWLDLLMVVNYKEGQVISGNEVLSCKRGQSMRSVENYQKRWNWTRQQVRSFLELLEKLSMITRETTSKTTIVTINNYDSYQGEQPTDNQPEETPIYNHQNNQQITNETTISNDCNTANCKDEQPTDNQQNNHQNNHKQEYIRNKEKNNYKKILLSEIEISDFPELKKDYLDVAKAFHLLFRNNLIEAGASTVSIDKAKGTSVDDIRLLIETDKYTLDDLRSVYKFLQQDAFWKQNILSTAKLREKMPQLKLKIHNVIIRSKNKEATSWDELAEVVFNALKKE